MKNFSELTDINTHDQLTVNVELSTNKDAVYTFKVNGKLLDQQIQTLKLDLLDKIELRCKVVQGSVEIKRIDINGFEVLPLYQHLAIPQTAWIDQEDWNFVIDIPFYEWKHRISGGGWVA